MEKTDKKRQVSKNAHKTFDLKQSLCKVTGKDFSKIPGINVLTAHIIISEVGLNMGILLVNEELKEEKKEARI